MTLLDDTFVNESSYHHATFEQWASTLEVIYGEKNKSRSPSDMWLRAVSDASKVGEAIRKNEPFEALDALMHTYGWIITTTNKLINLSYGGQPALQTFNQHPCQCLSELVLSKYPGICPYCHQKRCHCIVIRRKIAKEEKSKRRIRLSKTYATKMIKGSLPENIADICQMFNTIYGEGHYEIPIEMITFHFLEEVGEVAWCITSLQDGTQLNDDTISLQMQLSEEIADVIAWGVAIIGKLTTLASDSQKMLSEIYGLKVRASSTMEYDHQLLPIWLWRVFYEKNNQKLVCHTCHKSPCDC